MGRAKLLMKLGLKDTAEGIFNSDRSTVDRVTKGALGLTTIGIGAAIGLIGLGVKAAKKASENKKTEE